MRFAVIDTGHTTNVSLPPGPKCVAGPHWTFGSEQFANTVLISRVKGVIVAEIGVRPTIRRPVAATRATVSCRSAAVAIGYTIDSSCAGVDADDVGAVLREPDGLRTTLAARRSGDEATLPSNLLMRPPGIPRRCAGHDVGAGSQCRCWRGQ